MKNRAPLWNKFTAEEREYYRRFNSEWVGKYPTKGTQGLLPSEVMTERRCERNRRYKERKFRTSNKRVSLSLAVVPERPSMFEEVAQRVGEALSELPRPPKTKP